MESCLSRKRRFSAALFVLRSDVSGESLTFLKYLARLLHVTKDSKTTASDGGVVESRTVSESRKSSVRRENAFEFEGAFSIGVAAFWELVARVVLCFEACVDFVLDRLLGGGDWGSA